MLDRHFFVVYKNNRESEKPKTFKTGERKMNDGITVDQVKAFRRVLERDIAALICNYFNITGDNPEIKVERILVISEEGRSFRYEVKTK